jgi:hypothetical protein
MAAQLDAAVLQAEVARLTQENLELLEAVRGNRGGGGSCVI